MTALGQTTWEHSLSDVQSDIAPALRRAIDSPRFGLNDDDRQLLTSWIALQYPRGPDNKRLHAATALFPVRDSDRHGTPAYLQHLMSNRLEHPDSLERAERA